MKKIILSIIILALLGIAAYFSYVKWIHPSNKTNKSTSSENTNPDIAYYHCGMHPYITSDKPGRCPICGMDLTPVYKDKGNSSKGIVQIDPAMVQNIGVKTEVVKKRKLTRTIRTSGIVGYDETKQTVITTKFSGYIEKLYVDYTGKFVQQGQALFEIYSPDLVAAQQEYLQAIRYSKKTQSVNDSSISNELLQSAKKKLLYWDISPTQIKELEQTGNIKKTLTIYSPFSGIVIEKNIFEGMQVQAGMNLLKLADMSRMWIYADIYEDELSWVKTGDKANIELPDKAEKPITGKIDYIYPYLQDQTRVAKVRISAPNKNLLLKKDMYVTVNIIPTVSINAIAVPEQAVIHSGKRDVVVISLGEGKFMSMEVKLGALADGYYEIKEGLKEGDVIVTSSQFLIDSESNLKAGTSSMQGMPGMDMGGMKMEDKNKKQNMSDSSMQKMNMK